MNTQHNPFARIDEILGAAEARNLAGDKTAGQSEILMLALLSLQQEIVKVLGPAILAPQGAGIREAFRMVVTGIAPLVPDTKAALATVTATLADMKDTRNHYRQNRP